MTGISSARLKPPVGGSKYPILELDGYEVENRYIWIPSDGEQIHRDMNQSGQSYQVQ